MLPQSNVEFRTCRGLTRRRPQTQPNCLILLIFPELRWTLVQTFSQVLLIIASFPSMVNA